MLFGGTSKVIVKSCKCLTRSLIFFTAVDFRYKKLLIFIVIVSVSDSFFQFEHYVVAISGRLIWCPSNNSGISLFQMAFPRGSSWSLIPGIVTRNYSHEVYVTISHTMGESCKYMFLILQCSLIWRHLVPNP